MFEYGGRRLKVVLRRGTVAINETGLRRWSYIKTVVVLIHTNYKIATKLHSKTILYNSLRMCDVKNIFYSPNYKIGTTSYSKTFLKNHLRVRIINKRFCSSVIRRDKTVYIKRPLNCSMKDHYVMIVAILHIMHLNKQ